MTTRTAITRAVYAIAIHVRIGLAAVLLVILAGCGGGGGGAPAQTAVADRSTVTDCGAGYYWTGRMCTLLPPPTDGTSSIPSEPSTSSNQSDIDSCLNFGLFGTTIRPDCDGSAFDFSWFDGAAILTTGTLECALDVEPNDGRYSAAIVDVDDEQLGDSVNGVAVYGALSDGGDLVDNYVFMTAQAGQISISLHTGNFGGCGEATFVDILDTSTAYVEVFNQFGERIATSIYENVNSVSVPVVSGMPYYVSVVGSDLPQTQSYYLRFSELAPAPEGGSAEPTQPRAPDFAFYNKAALGIDTGMTASFYWNAPTLNADLTPLLDLQGYVLYYGRMPEEPWVLADLIYEHREPLDVERTGITVTVPDYGRWWFALTAVNSAGVESEYSIRILLTIADPETVRPEPPQLTLSFGGTMIATLDWIAPSLNTDGTALVDLHSYVLHYGNVEGGPYAYQTEFDLGLSSYTLPLPDYGEWYFTMTAVNAAGVESDFSNEVVHVDLAPSIP